LAEFNQLTLKWKWFDCAWSN